MASALEIGSRRELFVDDYLIAERPGTQLRLHQPTRREVVFRTDAPWEGNAAAYQCLIKDGDLYRLYYHGLHYTTGGPATLAQADHPPVLCCAESDDGLNWRRPELGLFEWQGSKANNIILTPDPIDGVAVDPAHAVVLLDTNPNCPPDQRYKLLGLGGTPGALYAFGSADGIAFKPLTTEPVITEGAFDSQNLAFWDSVRGEYREYHRGFNEGHRDIMTAASQDFLHFPAPRWIEYPDAPRQELYTNQIQPYYRAPHVFMGFPMRYTEGAWTDPVLDLPGVQERLTRAQAHPRYGSAVTDALFMTSRDGATFKRWSEAFIRPGPRRSGSWVYGDNLVFWGMFETPSDLPDAPPELSLYATEDYWEGTACSMRRFTIRIDGFVSAYAPFSGGELITQPLVFEGGQLTLNIETAGAGGLQVEVQEADGTPIVGYELDDCPAIRGDTLRHVARWTGAGSDLTMLQGRPIRLRFVLRDVDLYSLQFEPYHPQAERPALPG